MVNYKFILFSLIIGLLSISFVSAFSGLGSGIPSDPYQITNWSALNETRNNLTASYMLMNNLSSSTAEYSSFASANAWNTVNGTFSGSLNGMGYALNDMINNQSLFSTFTGNFTNITLGNFTIKALGNAVIAGIATTGTGMIVNGLYMDLVNFSASGNIPQEGLFFNTATGTIKNSVVKSRFFDAKYQAGVVYSTTSLTVDNLTVIQNGTWGIGANQGNTAMIVGSVGNNNQLILSNSTVIFQSNTPTILIGIFQGLTALNINLKGNNRIIWNNAGGNGNITFNGTQGLSHMGSGGLRQVIDNAVNITNNKVSVNYASFGWMQNPANVTLGLLPTNYTNPVVLRDGHNCASNICYNFTSLNAGTVNFNVSSWSINYSIGEGIVEIYPIVQNNPLINSVQIVSNITFNVTMTPNFLNISNATLTIYNETGSSIFTNTTSYVGQSTTKEQIWIYNHTLPQQYTWRVDVTGTNNVIYAGTNITYRVFYFLQGNGTITNPYNITDWRELDGVRYKLTSYFLLINNLSSSSNYYSGLGNNFTPITTGFTGKFNGGNNIISDLITTSTTTNDGLFANIASTGIINNLGLSNVSLPSNVASQSKGGIVGILDVGAIINNSYVIKSNFTQMAIGTGNMGGIAGLANGNISNSYTNLNITCNFNCGGISGVNQGTGTISNTNSTGIMYTNGASDSFGGITGFAQSGIIYNCSSSMGIYRQASTGRMQAGIAGQLGGAVINYSYYNGPGITLANNYAGGLVGYASSGTIENSYVILNGTGNITGSQYVGALVGRLNGATIRNSIAYIDVGYKIKSTAGSLGNVGTVSAGTATNVYMVVTNTTAGNITFIPLITDLASGEMMANITISNNYAFVNSKNTLLNKSANISLIGTFSSPLIYRDGVLCNASICTLLSNANGVVTFNVTGWSNYTIIEGITSTCTPPAINTNWNVLWSDNCTLSTNTNLGTGNLTLYGNVTGYFTLNANLTIHNENRVGVSGVKFVQLPGSKLIQI